MTVSMQGILKRFGSVQALAGVDFELRSGEIHGLLGENGAGKSTLMNVLSGLIPPDAGEIVIDGAEARLGSPHDAIALGVGMVHQHFMLVPTLTVAENLALGERHGRLLRKREIAEVVARLNALADRYGLEVDPHARVWQLSVGEQQRVEILRALYRGARILLLDEPTATLTPLETERLLPKLKALVEEGGSVVFISHHLEESLGFCDRITVLRGGKAVATVRPAETSTGELARLMVGRDVSLGRRPQVAAAGGATAELLTVSGLEAQSDRRIPALRRVDFSVAAGEIVAIAGVEGNGQTELEQVLFGLRRPEAGRVMFAGRDITGDDPAARLRAGIGLIPSDRYQSGLIRELSVAENLVCDRIGEKPFSTPLRLRREAIDAHARELVDRFAIRVSRPDQFAGTLSGGNAQKVVLARALSRDLRCLIAAQPSRGVDVGAMEFVWEQLRAARDAGLAVLLISTDLDEVLALADRCHVIYRGSLTAGWSRDELDGERIGLAMGGVGDAAAAEAALQAGR